MVQESKKCPCYSAAPVTKLQKNEGMSGKRLLQKGKDAAKETGSARESTAKRAKAENRD